ncbi:homeodomain-like protein [Rhizophagus clarus]|uniref:Homeodomain-like protein n=1 Tax=Rhizophagus clarus TaxID=94130 RepID=A0A8H3LG27_9GLOM|nr:homeodomain-like protein [Rhizophagus clarus]
MARAFSEDLKWRIVYLYHDGHNRKKIAELLHISKYTVDKVLQIYVQWGTVVNLWQKLPGCCKTLTRNEMKILQELVKDKVDWYLDELVGELELQTGKLLHRVAYEQNELLRSTFIAKVGRDYKPEQLIFMDEVAKDERSLSQGYGYSLKNTFATKKNVFKAIALKKDLRNLLFQTYVLVLDNARIHHDEDLIEYIKAFGSRVEFLPPYSPDFNPIETCFSVIKSFLKRYRDFVNSCNDSRYPLLIACSQITLQMVEGFFKGSIYM